MLSSLPKVRRWMRLAERHGDGQLLTAINCPIEMYMQCLEWVPSVY